MPVSPGAQAIITKHEAALGLLREQEKQLFADSTAEVRGLRFICAGCRKEATVGDLVFVQDTYITATHGCSGGGDQVDCSPGECKVVCPSCGQGVRLYNHSRGDDILACIEALKPCGLSAIFGEKMLRGRLVE